MSKKIISFDLSISMASKIIKDLAQDSSNIFLIDHAKNSMKKRHITLIQIIQCLVNGSITEGPYRDIGSGNWRVRMQHFSSGQCIRVVAELMTNDNNEKIIVITTF
ncbi:MAG: DUF4258 domain-containing protein [Methylococcales bacterium]|nr:MAG: DUF4258 domain-containing protein [Methylococcales bacterium]